MSTARRRARPAPLVFELDTCSPSIVAESAVTLPRIFEPTKYGAIRIK